MYTEPKVTGTARLQNIWIHIFLETKIFVSLLYYLQKVFHSLPLPSKFCKCKMRNGTYISVYFHEVQSTNQQNWYPGGHPGESLLYHWLEWWVAWKCWNGTINSVPQMNIHFTLIQVPLKLRQLHSPTVTAKFKTHFPSRKFSNRTW